MERIAKEARVRLDKLRPEASASPMAEDLMHLVRSEIADSIGDKGLARTELGAVTVDETTPQTHPSKRITSAELMRSTASSTIAKP